MHVSRVILKYSSAALRIGASVATVCACAALSTAAHAASSATIAPSLSPDRLGARGELTFTIRFASTASGAPAPLRRSIVQFPAGMSIEIPRLHSCTAARLRARGPSGCPAQSRLGGGQALAEVRAGSQTITEPVAMWAFLGPPRNLRPTLEILAQGYTPYDERMILTGTVLPASAPYGEQMVMSIPPIPTVPLEPDASIVMFSLTVGAKAHQSAAPSTVVVPSICPVGGFPFAAQFTYADGSSSAATATAPCPLNAPVLAAPTPHAERATVHAARTVSLGESGRLHLTSKHGFTLNEQGVASGTIRGTIYVHLNLISTTRATAEVSIYLKGGSLTGEAVAGYRRVGTSVSFSGSMSIVRGSGSYDHVHGSGLSFDGSIQESSSDAIAVHMSGAVSD